jgi:hypothetical protein
MGKAFLEFEAACFTSLEKLVGVSIRDGQTL